MGRIDFLRMRRVASSYGQPLTLAEQLELQRLESDLDDRRQGWLADERAQRGESGRACRPVAASVYEA